MHIKHRNEERRLIQHVQDRVRWRGSSAALIASLRNKQLSKSICQSYISHCIYSNQYLFAVICVRIPWNVFWVMDSNSKFAEETVCEIIRSLQELSININLIKPIQSIKFPLFVKVVYLEYLQ